MSHHTHDLNIIPGLTTPLPLKGDAANRAQTLIMNVASKVQHSFDTYHWLFQAGADLSWAEARERSAPWQEAIDRHAPQYMVELAAMAEFGAKADLKVDNHAVDLLDFVVLNARSEILSTAFLHHPECTTIGTSREGRVLLGETWDWFGTQRDSLVLLSIINDDGHTSWTVTEAGLLAKFGMNSAGLCLEMNFLSAQGGPAIPSESNGWVLPIHVMYRLLLDTCATVDEAINTLKTVGISGAINIPIADAQGNFVMMECMPGCEPAQVGGTNNGWIVHTNHCVVDSNVPVQGDLDWYTSQTETRFATATRLTNEVAPIDAISKHLEMMLCDTENGFSAICHGEDPSLHATKVDETVMAIVMETGPNLRRMRLAPGRPDLVGFYDIDLT